MFISILVSKRHYDAGFLLIDLLVAILLFSISLLGLLRYQQVLLAQAFYLSARQDAWRLAHQMLEVYPDQLVVENQRWQLEIEQRSIESGCSLVIAQVRKDSANTKRIDVKIERVFCEGLVTGQ